MGLLINPNRLALCIALVGNDHRAGVLLERILFWYGYAKVKIPGKVGKWVANDHLFWMLDAQLSCDQLSRSLKLLDAKGLIERTQFWFGRRTILHVRPSTKTTAFLEAAKTWPAANELLEKLKSCPTKISACAEPSSANSPNSNEISKNAEPTSADLLER